MKTTKIVTDLLFFDEQMGLCERLLGLPISPHFFEIAKEAMAALRIHNGVER
jgi:hypothetical protein